MKKRGQIFLLAALIMLAALISITIIYNSTSASRGDSKAKQLAKEIKYEGSRVLEYVIQPYTVTKDRCESKNAGYGWYKTPDCSGLECRGCSGYGYGWGEPTNEEKIKTFDEADTQIKNLLLAYAQMNPDVTIYAHLSYPSESRKKDYFYQDGKEKIPIPVTVSASESGYGGFGGDLTIRWVEAEKNIYSKLNLNSKAYNFNVMVEKRKDNEAIVATA